jgi:hypothetical protein
VIDVKLRAKRKSRGWAHVANDDCSRTSRKDCAVRNVSNEEAHANTFREDPRDMTGCIGSLWNNANRKLWSLCALPC